MCFVVVAAAAILFFLEVMLNISGLVDMKMNGPLARIAWPSDGLLQHRPRGILPCDTILGPARP